MTPAAGAPSFSGLDVGSALRVASDAIAAANVGDSPRLDAELLVCEVTGLDRAGLRARDDQMLSGVQSERLAGLVARRVRHEPVQYVIGRGWFYGLDIDVDRRVLVPRPETELLVDLALAELEARGAAHRGARQPLHVVDACTGSGCVAIAIAVEAERRFGPGSVQVTATDLSAEALDVARANARRLAPGVRMFEGSLLEPLADVAEHEPIDVLVANPPYVPRSDAAELASGVRDHEPHVALFIDGDDPGSLVRELARQAEPLLAPGALVAVEHGIGQRSTMLAALTHGVLGHGAGIDDLVGIDRVVTARAPGGPLDGGFAPLRVATRSDRSLVVRRLAPDDVPAFERLSGDVIAAGVGVPQLPNERISSPERLAAAWDPSEWNDCYLGAFDAATGELVGEASLRRLDLARVRHVAMLGISVAPPWQGDGVGRILTEQLLAWARAQRTRAIHRIELYVFADNDRARSLYASLGFTEEGRRRDFLQAADGDDYVDDIVMGLLLE